MKLLVVLVISLCSTIAINAQNWSSFRGNNASGVADGRKTATTWNVDKSQNIVWKTTIPGFSHASPIVWNDRVFVITAISSDSKTGFIAKDRGIDLAEDSVNHTWRIYSLDKKSGRIVWSQTAYEGVPRAKRHVKATQANSTPVTDGRYVVALFGSEGLACIAAFNLKDGNQAWRAERGEITSWTTPTINTTSTRAELIANGGRFIRGYDPLSGNELWRFADNDTQVKMQAPLVANGLIYITGGYPPGRAMYAFKPGAVGDISLKPDQETNEFIAWKSSKGSPYTPTPIIYGDQLYVVADNGVLTAYDARTGLLILRTKDFVYAVGER